MSQIVVVVGAWDYDGIGVKCVLCVFDHGACGALAWFVGSWESGVNEILGFVLRSHIESIDGNSRGCRGRARQTFTTNSAFLPHQQALNSRAQRCRDQPAGKPTRQWRHAAGQHPSIYAVLTPGRRIIGLSRASVTPIHRGRKRRPSSARGGPLRRLPPWCRLHSIWRLPGLGAPKSRIPLGWKNSGRH